MIALQPIDRKGEEEERKVCRRSDAVADEEWLPVLRHSPIHLLIPYNPYGLSEKFKVIFENGFIASGKLMEPFSWWPKALKVLDINDYSETDRKYIRRAWAVEQGWNELVAFYVERAMDWPLKPPTTGRYITNKQLYENDDRYWARFLYILPEYKIPVCLIAWYSGMTVVPPSLSIQEIMTHRKPLPISNKHKMETIKEISDIMIFDYIIGDHDRVEAHNWLMNRNGIYMHWDSGLAFRRGPIGRKDRGLDVFCGRREWHPHRGDSRRHCLRTCIFRKETVAKLKSYTGEHAIKLSERVHNKMKDDPLFPVFQYNAFYPSFNRFPKVRYTAENFLDGFDQRVDELLEYVDYCKRKYPDASVVI